MSTRLIRSKPAKKTRKPVQAEEEFKPDEIPQKTGITIEVSGEMDMGKTHFARTAPNPLFLDTEAKAYIVLKKFPPCPWKRVETFADIRNGVKWAIENPEIETVVIDSGSDVRDLAAQEWCNEMGKERVWPRVLWAQVYEKVDWIPKALEKAGKNLIVTARMKDEWIGDTSTGRRLADSYKRWPWALQMAITIQNGIRDGSKVYFKEHKFAKVRKNNHWGIDERTLLNYQKPYVFDVSWDGVLNEMLKPWGDGVPIGKELETVIKEAEEWLMERGARFRKPSPR